MKRRLIALLLCIAMIGSMTVYAVGDDPVCTCGTETEEHEADCALLAEPAPEPETDPACTCGTTTEEHAAECPLYVAPVEPATIEPDTQTTGPAVGDTIWINSGSTVYKKLGNNGGKVCEFSHAIKIEEILSDDDGAQWYKFSYVDITGAIFLHDYVYIKAENTSVTNPEEPSEPEDPRACTCGEAAQENLAYHMDDCPRKQYVKSLFEGKTAEEIYASWDAYDDGIRIDLLNMLQVWDEAKWLELKYLVDTQPDIDSGLNKEYVNYSSAAASGTAASIDAPKGAFPEGTIVTVNDVTVTPAEVQSVISDDIKGIVAVDIDFGGAQPSEKVVVRMKIPEDKIPADANMVHIVHMAASGPEISSTSYLSSGEGATIAFTANGFSSYAAVFVNGKYSSQKMSAFLAGNDRYSIANFNVDLFNYDPVTINDALDSLTSDKKGFHFTGYNVTNCGSNNGINNSSAEFAKQGILETDLVGGFPVIKHLNGADAGLNTGKLLFSASDYTGKKVTYNDIPFEIIYDENTGFYEYKSSANHAQLNSAGNKIELYADTLSTQNKYVWTADLSTAAGANDLTNPVASTNSYRATAINSASNTRLDPYVEFPVSDIAAANVDQIYVRAKVPASVGANKFQLFFKATDGTNTYGWHEQYSFGNASYSREIPYTANGDWIEFVIDTSDNATYWNDNLTITHIRVDLFDDNKGTLDSAGSYPIEIAQISFIQHVDAHETRGGFYPFSQIEDSYPGNNTQFNYSFWSNLIQSDGIAQALATRSIFNPAPTGTALYDELCYGMVMEFDFYLPVNKDGKDFTYYFNGDDDLWVFVDNKLALDIGGGHGAITGTLNFTNGAVNVANAVTVTGYDSGANTTASAKSSTMSDAQIAPGKHTMKIFYLERGGSVSNCFMKFNLPQTPQGSVSVTKNVVESTGASLDALSKEAFEFKIELQNKGAGAVDFAQKAPLANKEFYIVDTDNTTINSKTDANGKFTLKHGQEAIFEIAENYDVTVTETKKDVAGYDYVSTTVNDAKEYALTQLTKENQEIVFDFENTYTEKQVTLKYIPVNPDGCPTDKLGSVELTGDTSSRNTTGVEETIGMRLGVAVGSTATDNDIVEFVGWYSDVECTKLVSDDKAYLPTKADGSDLWEDATYYAKFEFKYGDLTIRKGGIQSVDHHAANGSSNEEKQTSIFQITGTSYSGQAIDMKVAIVGNSAVKIADLPVGEYKVTEVTEWSWRYEPTPAEENFVLTASGKFVGFTNSRENDRWLSGDNWIRNLLSMNQANG